MRGMCIDRNEHVNFRGKGAKCKSFKTDFKQNITIILTWNLKTSRGFYGIVFVVQKKGTTEDTHEFNFFKRYVDDTVHF